MLFPALHRILGLPPDSTTDEMIDAAVTGGPQRPTISTGGKLIPVSDLPLSEFPKDVAALANRVGGLLVYGVRKRRKRASSERSVRFVVAKVLPRAVAADIGPDPI